MKPLKKAIWIALAFSMISIGPQFGGTVAHADETPQQKAQDQADQANAQAKKNQRKMKQQARNAADQKNVLKDKRDQIENSADNASNSIKKEERHVGSG